MPRYSLRNTTLNTHRQPTFGCLTKDDQILVLSGKEALMFFDNATLYNLLPFHS